MSNLKLAPCKYKTGKTLGCGSYALVKEAVEIETGNIYAAKILNKKLLKGKENLIINEINVLKEVSNGHPNILTLVDYFETVNSLYLITDLAIGGELFDRLYEQGSFYEADASVLIYSILDALCYLHSKGVVHRDLKPENLLFKTKADDSPLLIADFGLARIVSEQDTQLRTLCGTPEYMAPEVFLNRGYGKPVDMWAVGVISYFILSGHCPFSKEDDHNAIESILNANYEFTPINIWDKISPSAMDFIRRLLVVDPEQRLTVEQALQHPWPKSHLDKRETDQNLLPKIRENFNAQKTFKKAFDVIKALNNMKKRNNNHPQDEDINNMNVLQFID